MNSNNVKLPRVKIIASNDYLTKYTPYLDEFIGKTGTLVWVNDPLYDYQCAVYLDSPHSIFGEFCNIVYFDPSGKNKRMQELYIEPVNGSKADDIIFMSKVIGKKWDRYRTSSGDPLTPDLVLNKFLKDVEKWNE